MDWLEQGMFAMLQYLQHTKSSCNRNQSTALLIFWIKLKTNLSFQQIASLLRKNDESGRKMVSRAFRTVANELAPENIDRISIKLRRKNHCITLKQKL